VVDELALEDIFLRVLLISFVNTISPTLLFMLYRGYIISVIGSVIQQHFKTDRSTDREKPKDLENTRSTLQTPGASKQSLKNARGDWNEAW
jgi:hypothetical protein